MGMPSSECPWVLQEFLKLLAEGEREGLEQIVQKRMEAERSVRLH